MGVRQQVLNHNLRMSSRWTGFFVWALVAASAVFWGMRIFAATRPVPPTAVLPQDGVAAQGPMTRLFGAIPVETTEQPAPAPESERFQLLGVIAPRSGTSGALALVAVDGQPAKAWRVGARIEDDTALLAVSKRSADFGPPGGPKAFTLDLPEPAAPETGTLPSAVSGDSGGAVPGRGAQPQPGFPNPGASRGAVLPGRTGFAARPGIIQPGMIPQMGVPNGRSQPMPGQAPDGDANAIKDEQ